MNCRSRRYTAGMSTSGTERLASRAARSERTLAASTTAATATYDAKIVRSPPHVGQRRIWPITTLSPKKVETPTKRIRLRRRPFRTRSAASASSNAGSRMRRRLLRRRCVVERHERAQRVRLPLDRGGEGGGEVDRGAEAP